MFLETCEIITFERMNAVIVIIQFKRGISFKTKLIFAKQLNNFDYVNLIKIKCFMLETISNLLNFKTIALTCMILFIL